MNSGNGAGSAYDVLIIGSGFGGAMAAHAFVRAGLEVLMLERGSWVERSPRTWAPNAVRELSPHYSTESWVRVRGDAKGREGAFHCVGGASVFYGGVAMRLREADFEPCAEIDLDSGAEWPYRYRDLEPYYGWAERILGVAGRAGDDPTDPPRSVPYPQSPPSMAPPARRIREASERLGLSPFHLPLAINFSCGGRGRPTCVRCSTCDGYACALSAKSDPSTAVLPDLLGRGLTLRADMVAVRLLHRGGRITGVECVERTTGRRRVFRAEHYVVAAGALASPQIVLASGLQGASPARAWVGRGLTRHCNGIVFGVLRRPLEGGGGFHKQVGIHDLYHPPTGAPDGRRSRLGGIQQIHPPPLALLEDHLPGFLQRFARPLAMRSLGLLVIAEDQPRRENGVTLHPHRTDPYGLPRAIVTHRYSQRDLEARGVLFQVARAILREAGAVGSVKYRIRTFSHALGTMRMGPDPRGAPLDGACRFRGVANLQVIDGSCMPRSGGVNPSLTIAANALRAATALVDSVAMPVAMREPASGMPVLVGSAPAGVAGPGRGGAAAAGRAG